MNYHSKERNSELQSNKTSCITTQRKGTVNLLRELIPYCSIRNNGLCFFFSYFVKEKYLHDTMISILDNPRLVLYIYTRHSWIQTSQ